MSSRYEEANKPSSWTNELNSVVQYEHRRRLRHARHLSALSAPKKEAPPDTLIWRRFSLTATRYSSRTRDAVVEVQSQAGATLQTISYANLKYGLTRQSVSFCLWQSTLDDLSPKPSFRRLPPPTAGRPGRTAAGGFLRRSSNGRRETTRNLPRQTTHKLTRPPSRISTDLLPHFFARSSTTLLPDLNRKIFIQTSPQILFLLLKFVLPAVRAFSFEKAGTDP